MHSVSLAGISTAERIRSGKRMKGPGGGRRGSIDEACSSGGGDKALLVRGKSRGLEGSE